MLVQGIYSRFLFVEPLKEKTAETVFRAILKVEYAFQYCFVSTICDKGSEFVNNLVKSHFKDINI